MLIAQLTDLHIRSVGRPANRVVETNMFAERAFRAVMARAQLPDVVLLTGDLAELGTEDEYSVLVDMLARTMRLPLFVIPGNHDRREAMIASLKGTPYNEGFIQYAVESFPVRLVMLDTLVPGAGCGELCKRRLDWLERTLAARPEAPTLIAMHHPPFQTGITHMDHIALRNSADFAAILERHPQVRIVICGHVHRSVTARIGNAVVSIAPSVAHQIELDLRPDAPPAFVMEPPAYHLHQWSKDGGFVTHTAYIEAYPGPFPFLGEGEAAAKT